MDPKIAALIERIQSKIEELEYGKSPEELYDPIGYIMSLGGKRLRPLLVLLSYGLFKENTDKAVTPAAAVEVFHNFTLMHDDIMDNAPIRRGKPTVHEKWNDNIAILSGDVMLVNVYEILLQVDDHLVKEVLRKFNRCAAEVCEGQQHDMNFETRDNVTIDEYLNMIKLKTAVLLGFSMELGAILAEASEQDQSLLKEFGTNIGIGFQLKDDLLDLYADQLKFGKQVGGDIIANKKTYLLLKALQIANPEQKAILHDWLSKTEFVNDEKVNAIKSVFDQLNIKESTEEVMNQYFEDGFAALAKLQLPSDKKSLLEQFTRQLINREN